MRAYKDYDLELKALADKTRKLKDQRTRQLGELVTATGADALDMDTLAGALLHAANMHDAATREAWRVMGVGFFAAISARLRRDLVATAGALKRGMAMQHRIEAQRARSDTRNWVIKRRERTRHLIELGGLVVKAGLVDLAGDDRATIYGAFLALADTLRGEDHAHALALWKRKGQRAFESEQGSRDKRA
jgi:hypothetical protein